MKKSYENLMAINPNAINWFPTIGFKLTNSCRLKCSFCCEPERNREKYNLNELKLISELLWEYGTKRLCFTGGDPLLYKDLPQLMEHTNNLGFYNLLLTADGSLLKNRIKEISKYTHGIRLSVHGLYQNHDKIVGKKGVFKDIEESISILRQYNIPTFASTVLTTKIIPEISKIANWCNDNGIKKYYIYGLVRSGNGNKYINEHGIPDVKTFNQLINTLKDRYESMEIKFYDYIENAECILVYGNGDIIIDPYFEGDNFQLKIGNIHIDNKNKIWKEFMNDCSNLCGYKRHLSNAL